MSLEEIKKDYAKFINIKLPEIYYRTSLLSLNELIGGKGIKGGRFLQIIGYERVGKTTMAMDIIKNAQLDGHTAAFVDIERTFDPDYAATLGVDTDKLLMVYPETSEQAMQIIEALVKSGDVKIIVLDSVPAMLPSSELEKEYTDSEKMGSSALLLSRAIRRLTPILSNHGALLILINQWRANISTMAKSDKKPYGANALRYATGLKLELARVKNESGKATVQIVLEKSKQSGTEGGKIEVSLKHGYGFDVEDDILTLALQLGIVTMNGNSVYVYGDEKIRGRDKAKEQLPMQKIKNEVLERIK